MPIFDPIQSVMQNPIGEPVYTLSTDASAQDPLASTGGFSTGFSVGFDIKYLNHRAFTSGFSFGFARFEFRKAYSSGFSSGFATENR